MKRFISTQYDLHAAEKLKDFNGEILFISAKHDRVLQRKGSDLSAAASQYMRDLQILT